MQKENFINIGTLIDQLREHELLKEDDKQLNVFFDNWAESLLFRANWWVEILSFSVIDANNKTRTLSFAEFHDAVPFKYYLNIGKQVSKSMRSLPMKKDIHKLMVRLDKIVLDDFSYYPIKLYEGENLPSYTKLLRERSDAKVNQCNHYVELCNGNEFYEDEEE